MAMAATFVFVAEFALVKSQLPKDLAHRPLYGTNSIFGLYVPVASLFIQPVSGDTPCLRPHRIAQGVSVERGALTTSP